MKAGDKVKFIHPEIWDDKEHTILNIQRTHGDVCFFLHYWSWIDEDELILVEDTMKVKVGDKFKWNSTPYDIAEIIKIAGDEVTFKCSADGYSSTVYLSNMEKEGWFKRLITASTKEVVKQPVAVDNVVSPVHYNTTKISALDVVNDWNLNFYLGNTIKYIKRYELKDNPIQDLKKAAQYLQLLIDKLEKDNK